MPTLHVGGRRFESCHGYLVESPVTAMFRPADMDRPWKPGKPLVVFVNRVQNPPRPKRITLALDSGKYHRGEIARVLAYQITPVPMLVIMGGPKSMTAKELLTSLHKEGDVVVLDERAVKQPILWYLSPAGDHDKMMPSSVFVSKPTIDTIKKTSNITLIEGRQPSVFRYHDGDLFEWRITLPEPDK